MLLLISKSFKKMEKFTQGWFPSASREIDFLSMKHSNKSTNDKNNIYHLFWNLDEMDTVTISLSVL